MSVHALEALSIDVDHLASCGIRGDRARRLLGMWITCKQHFHMSKMILLRSVPDALHRQLKARAALARMSLSDYLIREARKLVEYPTPEEIRARLRQSAPYRGKAIPAEVVRQERDAR